MQDQTSLIVPLIRSIDGPGFDFAIHSLILNVVILDQSYKLTPEVDEFINAPKEEIRNAEVAIAGRFMRGDEMRLVMYDIKPGF